MSQRDLSTKFGVLLPPANGNPVFSNDNQMPPPEERDLEHQRVFSRYLTYIKSCNK